MSANQEQESQRYLKFLKDNGIQVKSSTPIFNAKAARKKVKLRLKRGGSTLFTVYPEQPKLSKKERKALKKLRKEFRKKKQAERQQRLFKERQHYLGASKADLKAMPYDEFLQSGYWWCVRALVLKRDKYHCQRCNSGHHLQVHHLTYAHHGEEHKFLNELLTLCDTCHQDAHGLGDHKPKLERHKSPAVNRIATEHATPTPATCKPSPINGTGSGISKPALQAENPCSSDPHRSPVASGMSRVVSQR